MALTKELLEKDIKHHHAISSAYTEWSLINSGKGEAKKALDLAESTVKEIKSLFPSLDSVKKTSSDAASTAKTAKSQADKALSKVDKLGKSDNK